MLVISRERDSALMIGNYIEVRVVDIRGDRVWLGIQAPFSVSIRRKEDEQGSPGGSIRVIQRGRGESVLIGDSIEAVIVDIRGDKTRLGVIVPREISVHRKEVYDFIQRERPRDP